MEKTNLEGWLARRGPVGGTRVGFPGARVGDWCLKAYLGGGAGGEVWHAEQEDGGGSVAVKILLNSNENALKRFRLAVRFLRENEHRGFPEFHGAGLWNGLPYLAMEELSPGPLPMDDASVAKFLVGVAEALAHLHGKGLVHRDVKPSNIMFRGDGNPVLVDFDLLKAVPPSGNGPNPDSVSIMDGKVMAAGTPGFAAPEQLTGGDISPASDIHALGVLVDACFRGNPPRAWEHVVRRCTSSLAAHRFSDMGEFLRAVRRRHACRRGLMALTGALAAVVLAVGGQAGYRAYRAWKDVLHVCAAADARRADGSASRPFASVQAACDRARPNAIVRVAPGEYEGEIALTGKIVRLVAVGGPGRTVLRGRRGASVVRIASSASGSSLEGFTITGGSGTPSPSTYGSDNYGGGVFAEGSARLERCVVEGNGRGEPRRTSATFGGGVCVTNGTLSLRDCEIRGNFAWASGGGVMACGQNAALLMEGCSVEGNASTDFFGNQAGVGLADRAVLVAKNCDFAGNRGDQVGAFGATYARGTRALLDGCRVDGGARACNIEIFSSRNER